MKNLAPTGISSNENTNIFYPIDHAQDVEEVSQVTGDTITTQNIENEGESAIQGASEETPSTVENV